MQAENMPSVNGPPRKLDLEISRELGQIHARLDSISQGVSHITGEHKTQSGEFRAEIRAVRDEIGRLRESLDTVRQRQFATGAALSLIGILFGAVLTKFGINLLP